MDSKTQNYLTMAGTCIATAQNPVHQPAWRGQEPSDFGEDLGTVVTNHAALVAKAALWDAATGGAGDAKATAETTLENTAYLLARACYNHFKKTGDLIGAGKVDYTKSDLVKLRAQELLTQTTAIRDLAQQAAAHPEAAGRGVTPARIATLTAAITAYTALMSAPRGQIVNRSALGKEIETETAALLSLLHDMDDLVIQFDTTPAGHLFMEAWKRSRIIVDSGGGHSRPGNGNEEPPPPPASPPAQPQ
ncbi:MAG: hypothetical protein V4726_24885 [Verrucomicrobiota bacterium]